MVEQAGQQLPPEGESQPAHVRHRDPVRHNGCQPGQPCSAVLVEAARVDKQPIRRAHHLRELARAERGIVRPPQHDRQIVDQEWRHDARQVLRKLATGLDDDLLGAHLRVRAFGNLAVGVDMRVHDRWPVEVARRNHDRARRVSLVERVDRRQSPLRCLRPGSDDDQCQDARPHAHPHRPATFLQPGEMPVSWPVAHDFSGQLAALGLLSGRRPNLAQLLHALADAVGAHVPAGRLRLDRVAWVSGLDRAG